MKRKSAVLGSSNEAQQLPGGDTALKQPFDELMFQAGVAGYLRTAKHIPLEGDYTQQEAFSQAIELFEIQGGKWAKDYPSAIDALIGFKTWLDSSGWKYEKAKTYVLNTITVSVTMPTPSGQLTVSMVVEPLINNHAQVIRDAKDYLEEQVKKTFGGNGKREMPATNGESASKQEAETDRDHCSVLVVKHYKGKTYWNAIPDEGKWTKFGIPLYSDVARKFKIALPDEDGEYDIDWDIDYELKEDGKPLRVTDIYTE